MSSSGGFKGNLSGETRKALIEELKQLRRRVDELELIEAERERAESALRESDARLKAIIENSPIEINLKDTDGRYVLVNPYFEKMHGVPREEAKGKTAYDLFPKELADCFSALDQEVLENRAAIKQAQDIPLADGVHSFITIKFPVLDSRGTIVAIGETSVDITERIEAEKGNALLATFLEHTADAIEVVDTEARIQYVNPAHEKITGYSASEALGKTPASLHRPKDHDPKIYEDIWDTISSGRVWKGNLLGRRKDGVLWHQAATISPVFDDTGAITHYIAIKRDVSELKRREEGLRESEARHREIFEQSPIGIWEEDYSGVKRMIDRLRKKGVRDFRRYFREHPRVLRQMVKAIKVIEVNQALLDAYRVPDKETFVQWSEDPARTDPWMSFYEQELAALAAGESRFALEYADKAFDGSDIVIRATTKIGDAYKDTWTRVVSTVEDITERKRAEEALRESEQRFRSLVANVPGEVFQRKLTPEGQLVFSYVSPGLRELWGVEPEDIIADPSAFLRVSIPAEDRKRFMTALNHSARTLSPMDLELRVVSADGVTRWVRTISRPFRRESGEVVWDGVSIDITEQKKAQETAREHEKELAEVLRRTTMGEMASALAHELNQPLASILNYCRGCLLRTQSGQWTSGDFIDALEKTCEQAERAGRIIHHVRDFVCASEPQESQVNVNDIIRAMVPFAKAEANEQGVWLRLDLADAIPPVSAQQIEIEHVVLNLVRNGIEAIMDDNGEKRELTVRTSMSGREAVEIAVHDTGRGVPTEIRDQMFKPFYTTKSNGMGMGLAISRSIVERHGGRIWATPNAECGTTFRFTLPTVKDGASP